MKIQIVSDWHTAPLWQKFLLGVIGLLLIVLFFKDTLMIKPYRAFKSAQNQYQNLNQQIKTAKLLLNDEKVVAENLQKTQRQFFEQIPSKKEVGPWLNQLTQGLMKLELVQPLNQELNSNAVFSQSIYRIELRGSGRGFEQFLTKTLASSFHPEIKKLEIRQVSGDQYRYLLELNVLTAKRPTQAKLYPKQANPKTAVLSGVPVLQGFWNGETPKALINGQLVGIGDYVGNHHVLQIKPNEKFVILEKDSKTLRLQL